MILFLEWSFHVTFWVHSVMLSLNPKKCVSPYIAIWQSSMGPEPINLGSVWENLPLIIIIILPSLIYTEYMCRNIYEGKVTSAMNSIWIYSASWMNFMKSFNDLKRKNWLRNCEESLEKCFVNIPEKKLCQGIWITVTLSWLLHDLFFHFPCLFFYFLFWACTWFQQHWCKFFMQPKYKKKRKN